VTTLPSPSPAGTGLAVQVDVAVIGAGQAGLSAGYHLQRRGLTPGRGYVILDASPGPGGAWRERWPSLTLNTVNRVHDLPGLPFTDVVGTQAGEVQASLAVPAYFAEYEQRYRLPVYRPSGWRSSRRTAPGCASRRTG